MKKSLKLFSNLLIIVIILNLFTMINVFAGSGSTLDLTAVIDAHSNAGDSYKAFEFGGATEMPVRSYSSGTTIGQCYTYLKFDLSSIPENSKITSAYLELTLNRAATYGASNNYRLYKLKDSFGWSKETTSTSGATPPNTTEYLTANNSTTVVPIDTTTVAWASGFTNDASYNGRALGNKIRFTFPADALQRFDDNNNNIGFKIGHDFIDTSNILSYFASDENTTVAYRPKLHIEYLESITPVLDGVTDTNNVEIGEIKINFPNSTFTTNQITQGDVVVKEGANDISSTVTGFSFTPTNGTTPANVKLTITGMKPSTQYTISFANTLIDDNDKIINPLSFITKDKEVKITGISFLEQNNNEELTQIKAGTIKTTINVEGSSATSSINVVAVLALYNNNDMIAYKVSNAITLDNVNTTGTITFENDNTITVSDANNSYIRVFLWDGEATMVPLANPWELSSTKGEVTQ